MKDDKFTWTDDDIETAVSGDAAIDTFIEKLEARIDAMMERLSQKYDDEELEDMELEDEDDEDTTWED